MTTKHLLKKKNNGTREAKTGCRELVQTQGLHQVEDILDKYGIGSGTYVSDLKEHDFNQLEDRGIKPFQLKKVKG